MKPSKNPAAPQLSKQVEIAFSSVQLNRESKNDSVISAGENKMYLAIDTRQPIGVGLPLIIDSINYLDKRKSGGKVDHKGRGASPSTA